MRGSLIALVFSAAIGCSSPQPTVAPAADAQDVSVVDAAPDIAADITTDIVRPNTSDAATDATPDADDAADAPDATDASADVVIDPGMCGPGVRRCFCDCAGNGVCTNGCIARDIDCGGCIYNAATRCCPDLGRVFESCIDTSMCADDACIARVCGAEQRAFESCFAALQMSDDRCRAEMRVCLGPDFPMIQCVTTP